MAGHPTNQFLSLSHSQFFLSYAFFLTHGHQPWQEFGVRFSSSSESSRQAKLDLVSCGRQIRWTKSHLPTEVLKNT